MSIIPHVAIIGRTMFSLGLAGHLVNIAFGQSIAAILPDFTESRMLYASCAACLVGTLALAGVALHRG